MCLKFHYYVTTPVPLILQRIQFNIQGLSILKFAIISLETMSIMVIVKFSLLVLKISLLIFLESHLINKDLISFEMNLELLISNLWNKSVYAEWIGCFCYIAILQIFVLNFIPEQFTGSICSFTDCLTSFDFTYCFVFFLFFWFSFTVSSSHYYSLFLDQFLKSD